MSLALQHHKRRHRAAFRTRPFRVREAQRELHGSRTCAATRGRDASRLELLTANWDFDADAGPDPGNHSFDGREPKLSLIEETLQVHHVSGISITTEVYDLSRYRFQNPRSKLTRSSEIEEDPSTF